MSSDEEPPLPPPPPPEEPAEPADPVEPEEPTDPEEPEEPEESKPEPDDQTDEETDEQPALLFRDDQLSALRAAAEEHKSGLRALIVGYATGASALAAEAVSDARFAWLRASSQAELRQELRSVGEELRLPLDGLTADEVCAQVLGALAEPGDVVVVLDALRPGVLPPGFLPESLCVIATSRDGDALDPAHVTVTLAPWTGEQTAEALRAMTGGVEVPAEAAKLCGGVPAAVALVAAFVRCWEASAADLAALLREGADSLANYDGDDTAMAVAVAVSATCAALDNDDSRALEALRFASYLHSSSIPVTIFAYMGSADERADALETLSASGVLVVQGAAAHTSDLVQSAVRYLSEPEGASAAAQARGRALGGIGMALCMLLCRGPSPGSETQRTVLRTLLRRMRQWDFHDPDTWRPARALVLHVLHACRLVGDRYDLAAERVGLLALAGHFQLYGLNDAPQSVGTLREALRLAETSFGAEHESVGSILADLGTALGEVGQHEEHLELLERAMRMFEGDDDPEMAGTLISLAAAYGSNGRGAERVGALRQALGILERACGETAPEVGTALQHLAEALRAEGDADGHVESLQRALALQDRSSTPDLHVSYRLLFDLGEALTAYGNAPAAVPALRRCLAVAERAYGAESEAAALALGNLGGVLRASGQPAAALETLERALELKGLVFGEDHVEYAATLTNLGNAAGDTGDSERRLRLLADALAIKERAFGADAAECVLTMSSLAMAAADAGDLPRARELAERVAAARERDRGAAHADTAAALAALAATCLAAGDAEAALAAALRAAAVQELPATLAVAADAHEALGQQAEADALRERVAELEAAAEVAAAGAAANAAAMQADANQGFDVPADPELEAEARALIDDVRLAEAQLGPDAAELVDPLLDLADVFDRANEPASRLRAAERAVKLAAEDELAVPAQFALAAALCDTAGHRRAAQLLEAALDGVQRLHGDEPSAERGHLLVALAGAARGCDDWPAAARAAEGAAAEFEALYGPHSPGLVDPLDRLADALAQQSGDDDERVRECRARAKAIFVACADGVAERAEQADRKIAAAVRAAPAAQVHLGTECVGCGAAPILGPAVACGEEGCGAALCALCAVVAERAHPQHAGAALEGLEPTPVPASHGRKHDGVDCLGCHSDAIVGTRFVCATCHGASLCPDCLADADKLHPHAEAWAAVRFAVHGHCAHCTGEGPLCACVHGCVRGVGSRCAPEHCRHCPGRPGACACSAGCEREEEGVLCG